MHTFIILGKRTKEKINVRKKLKVYFDHDIRA
jgi:hypothetical protein